MAISEGALSPLATCRYTDLTVAIYRETDSRTIGFSVQATVIVVIYSNQLKHMQTCSDNLLSPYIPTFNLSHSELKGIVRTSI